MIRKPLAEELAPFAKRTIAEHEAWIWQGLFGYLFQDSGYAAFPGAEPFIGQIEGGLASDLGDLFNSLPRRSLDQVRAAVVSALSKADLLDPNELTVARILLQLGANIKAISLPAIIARKRLTIPATDVGRSFFATAFDIAAQAGFREANDSVRCLRQLVEIPLFPPPWIGRALIGMTRADPDSFSSHYDLLRVRLNEAYRIEHARRLGSVEKGAERVSVIRQIARLLGDYRRADLAHPLSDGDPNSWWVQALEDPRLSDLRAQISDVIGESEPARNPPAETNRAGGASVEYDTFEQFWEALA